jgi:hypothetical protein
MRIEFDCLIRKIPTTSSKFVQEARGSQTGELPYFNTCTALGDVQTIATEAVSGPKERTGPVIGQQEGGTTKWEGGPDSTRRGARAHTHCWPFV